MNPKSAWTQLRHVLGGYPTTAAEWAVRVQCADVTRQELLVLDAWLKTNPKNAEDYARTNKIGHLGLMLREHRDELARLRDYQELRQAEKREAPSLQRPLALQWGTAFVLCLILTGVFIVYGLRVHTGHRYVVAHGEQRQVELTDGSRMVVNTDSEVRVRFDAAKREIVMPRGEAFFDVAKSSLRPFVVWAGDTEVRAIGTKFSVRKDEGRTEVIVTDGRVRVSRESGPGAESHELGPGQRLEMKEHKETPEIQSVDAARETAWATGTVEFEDAQLDEVVREVNRYIPKTLVIGDSRLTTIRMTGRFRIGEIEAVKFALRDRFGITAVEGMKEIRLMAPETNGSP